MNLADPELELIDPTPNVHLLFIQFDQMFFWTKLASRAVVKWSKRMYSCAGVCSYEGRGGLCNISLSEPLLKLRPRKDLVETLLHEMIHAFLFVTCRDQDRDGHGPNFKAHMHRINNAAGLNISIYHSFHEEVELYQTHWWRCNGPCQTRKPHFGIVRRSANRVPGPSDYWWSDHLRKCGGTFIKFKEPEKTAMKSVATKPKGDITKYVKTTKKIKAPVGEPEIQVSVKSNIKVPAKSLLPKSKGSNITVVTQKGLTSGDSVVKQPTVFTGKGNTIMGSRVRSSSVDAAEVVRNIWANKQLNSVVSPISNPKGRLSSRGNTVLKPATDKLTKVDANIDRSSPNNIKKATKQKADSTHADSPPVKIKKIDDYFKATATSLLKDIYGDNIEIAESNNANKFIAVHNASVSKPIEVLVDCPICKLKVDEKFINGHLDECLNKDIISKICAGNAGAREKNVPASTIKMEHPIKVESSVKLLPPKNEMPLDPTVKISKPALKEILHNLPPIPAYKGKVEDSDGNINTLRDTFLSNIKHTRDIIKEPKSLDDNINWEDVLKHDIPKTKFDADDVANVKSVVKKIQFDKHLRKSDNFIVPKVEKHLESGSSPSFVSEDAKTIELPPIKLEPGSVVSALIDHKCPCCGVKVTKPINEHLDECLAFLVNDTEPEEGASTSFANHTIVIDDDEDDDVLDETQLFNATGTKLPCPCCLIMVENDEMNAHIDNCLS